MHDDFEETRVSAEPLLPEHEEGTGGHRVLPVLLLLLVASLAAAAIYTPALEVRRIEVRCQNRTIARELGQVVKPYLGDNLLLADLQSLREAFADDIRFEHVAVLRKLPGTLVVQVFCRQPAFVVKAGSFFYLCDKYGICYEGAASFRPDLASVELPIHGADLLGAALPEELTRYLLALSERLRLIRLGQDEVLQVVPGGEVTVSLRVDRGKRLEIALGDSSQMDLKLATAQSALAEASRQGLRLARLDVSNPEGCVARLED